MKTRVAALGCSIVLALAACGSDSSSGGDSTTPATATTSTAAPEPTSTVAAPSTTPATTVETDAPTTDAPATTDAVDTTDAADTTDAPDTTGGTSDSTDTSTGGPATAGAEYVPVTSPAIPNATQPVAATGAQPDGVYYASVSEGGDPAPPAGSVVFEVVQLFTGPDCLAHFGEEDEDACVNDYGVETDPTASVVIELGDQFISVVDAATQQSYQISGAELYDLLLGDVPSTDAPVDYLYSGFGYLATFSGGEITRLEQWWTP